jgi:hypothetical protein
MTHEEQQSLFAIASDKKKKPDNTLETSSAIPTDFLGNPLPPPRFKTVNRPATATPPAEPREGSHAFLLSDSDIESFKRLDIVVTLNSPKHGRIHLVPWASDWGRRELSAEHAAFLINACELLGGATLEELREMPPQDGGQVQPDNGNVNQVAPNEKEKAS